MHTNNAAIIKRSAHLSLRHAWFKCQPMLPCHSKCIRHAESTLYDIISLTPYDRNKSKSAYEQLLN